MISGYEWDEYFLYVCCRIGGNSYFFILKDTTQEQFFEYIYSHMTDRHGVAELIVTPLSEGAFEFLENQYNSTGFENRVLIEGEIQ